MNKNNYDDVKKEIEKDGEFILISKEYINNTSPIEIQHIKCGNIYTTTLKMHRYSIKHTQDCRFCRENKNRKSYEDVKEEIEKDGEFILISKEYINNTSPIEIQHIKCGNIYTTTLKEHLISVKKTKDCRFCRENKNRKSYEDVKEEIEKDGNYVLLSSNYINNRKAINILHLKCNRLFQTSLTSFRNIKECPHCSGKKKLSIDEVKEKIESTKEYELLSETYNKNTDKLLIKCNICQNTFLSRYDTFRIGYKCPYCSGHKHDNTYFKNLIENNNEYELLNSEVNGIFDEVQIKHVKCNTIFNMSPNKFRHRSIACPVCSKTAKSNEENELYLYIKEIYNGTIIRNFRSPLIDNKELDIYLPDLNLAIEYNGLYWHSNEFIANDYHYKKMILCREQNIRLITIFSDEWKHQKEIIKNKLKHILNLHNEAIYARKCKIIEISTEEKNNFLDKYHIQGKDICSLKYALTYNNEICAVMTLCKNRMIMGEKNIENQYELSRYATSKSVIGGFSKLLKYILNNHKIDRLKTFADLRYTDLNNNVYIKNNFVLDHISKPNYYYIKNDKKYYRFHYSKQNIKINHPEIYDDSLTEEQLTNILGLSKIYDCGMAVFLYKTKE